MLGGADKACSRGLGRGRKLGSVGYVQSAKDDWRDCSIYTMIFRRQHILDDR